MLYFKLSSVYGCLLSCVSYCNGLGFIVVLYYRCIVTILCVLYAYCCLCAYCCLFAYCCTTLDAGLLARSQYSEGPATDHLDTGFSWFPCVYKRMLRWFPRFQVATTCFSCIPPALNVNLLIISFLYLYTC
jgi:hypothetical protein